MNGYACRICPERYATAEERAACEQQDIAERVWLTA